MVQPAPEDDAQAETASVSSPVRTKRRRTELNSDSDDDDGDRSGKRPLDLSALPWMQDVQPISLPPSLADTRKLLLLFAEEPKRWKTFFINEPNCPQFPDSEWTNILLGRPINLDSVLASMFSITLEHKHKERLGRVSFALDDVAPSKIVRSQGDWLSAWRAASDAISFVFRHRRDKLAQYNSHISSMFTSVLEVNHARVLCYDKAVRLRVSGRRDLLLTDTSQFSDLHTLWLSPLGAGPSAGTSRAGGTRPTPKSAGSKKEPCRRWNDGKCPFNALTCNWGHVCLKCSGSHTANTCTQRG